MLGNPLDTSEEARAYQLSVLRQMDGEARLRIAIDLSESVREIRIQGLLARQLSWSRADAVRHLVLEQAGIDLSDGAERLHAPAPFQPIRGRGATGSGAIDRDREERG